MTVFCLEEDGEDVKSQLFDNDNPDCFFLSNDCPLTNIKVEILEPTAEEDRQACENLDVFLEADNT
jgi:tRNA pseudouridine-54 N-methylase